ncbi:MAG: peptidoglycan-binding protein [Candidatus Harrisonbacteria bacterium]|nr:peptidoglycan-binding protein [Candidatus Harrisonbacteria bacterium]
MNSHFRKITSVAVSATTVAWLSGASMLMPAAFAQSVTDVASLQALIAQLTAQLAALQGSGSASTGVSVAGIPAGFQFTSNLTVGSRGTDVKYLQMLLNADSATQVAASGAGSRGLETDSFGPRTKAAVAKFQNKYASEVLTPAGLTTGTGYWGAATRAKANSIVMAGGSTTPTPTPTPGITGAVVVSLASDTPVASNVPKGASQIPFTKLVFTGNGRIDSLTFKRVGVGQTGDFVSSGINLYEGATRLTTGKTINSTSHEVNFPNLNLQVSGTRTLLLAADISSSATSGDLNGFTLISAIIDGKTQATDIRGAQIAISGASVGAATSTKQGSLSNPNVGQVAAKVSEFKITAGTAEDIMVKKIVLTNGGSMSSANLTNVTIKQSGTTLGTAAAVSGRDLFVVDFTTPLQILKGQSKNFEVFGNISPLAKRAETIKLYLDTTSDIFATGATYGYGVSMDISEFDSDSSNHHVLTLSGAEVTITFNGPVARNIPVRGQDVTLFDFSIASANNIEIRNSSFTVAIANWASGDEVTDFKVIDASTGAAVTSATTIGDSAATESVSFTDTINIAAGQTRKFLVTGDISSTMDASDTITVTLGAFGSSSIKNLDNNQFVSTSDIVPATAIAGNTQTVKAVTLDVTLSGTPASHNVVKGSSNEQLVGFNLKATSGKVRVSSLTVSASAAPGSETQVRNDLRSASLLIDGVMVGSKKSFTDEGDVSSAAFDNLNYEIEEGKTVKAVVQVDQISTDATSGNVYRAYINDLSADISATDVDGNALSLSGSVNGGDTTAGTVTVTVATPTVQISKIDDQETEEGLVVGGQEQRLAKFEVFAQYSDVRINKWRVGVNTSAAAGTTTALNEEVKEIRLYDGATLIASGVPSGSGADAGAVKFENTAGLFSVAANSTKKIEVRAMLGEVTGVTGGADTGSSIVAYSSSSDFEAVAGNTQLTTFSSTTPPIGNIKRLYRSIPTVDVSSPSSAVLTAGEVEALKFTISADPKGDVDVARVEFEVSVSNATITADSIVVRYAGSNITLSTSTIIAANPSTTTASGTISFTTPERISAGQSKTYSVFLTVGAVGSGSASLVTKLLRDETAFATPASRASLDVTANSFVWSDRGISPHSVSTADFHNGFRVKTLPSGAKALSKS